MTIQIVTGSIWLNNANTSEEGQHGPTEVYIRQRRRAVLTGQEHILKFAPVQPGDRFIEYADGRGFFMIGIGFGYPFDLPAAQWINEVPTRCVQLVSVRVFTPEIALNEIPFRVSVRGSARRLNSEAGERLWDFLVNSPRGIVQS
jgi:hypothetical protein